MSLKLVRRSCGRQEKEEEEESMGIILKELIKNIKGLKKCKTR